MPESAWRTAPAEGTATFSGGRGRRWRRVRGVEGEGGREGGVLSDFPLRRDCYLQIQGFLLRTGQTGRVVNELQIAQATEGCRSGPAECNSHGALPATFASNITSPCTSQTPNACRTRAVSLLLLLPPPPPLPSLPANQQAPSKLHSFSHISSQQKLKNKLTTSSRLHLRAR